MSASEASPLEDATEELARALLPILLERMRAASRRLDACSRRLAAGGGGLGRRGGLELDDVQEEADRLGWVLGVVAAAAGDDLLLARREPYGPAIVVDLVAEVLAAEGRALEPDASGLPDVAPRLEDGWRLPWAFGLLVRCAARFAPERAPVRWRLERDASVRLLLLGEPPSAAAPLLVELEDLLPGAEACVEPGAFGMAFPAAWFQPEPAAAARGV